MQDFLIVVDMQNDFVDGALGTAEAVSIVPHVADRIAKGRKDGEHIIFTRDTHQADYLDTLEGKKLPVPHCIEGSGGFQIVAALSEYAGENEVINKPSFGSVALGERLLEENKKETVGKITLIGLCTDICVISNALLLKAYLPDVEIAVDASCCAGVTPDSHRNALIAMKACQIEIESF